MVQPGAESVPWQNGMNRRPAYAFGPFGISKITIFDGRRGSVGNQISEDKNKFIFKYREQYLCLKIVNTAILQKS